MTHVSYVGHDPTTGEEGTDVLLTCWADGTAEFATRPGKDRTDLRWSPPVWLAVAP